MLYYIIYYILYMAMFNRTIIFPNLPTWPWISRFFRFGLRIWRVMTPHDPNTRGFHEKRPAAGYPEWGDAVYGEAPRSQLTLQ